MIEHGDVHRLAEQGQPPGHGAVARAWRGVAGRVVMGQDQPGAAMYRRIANDLAQRNLGAGLMPVMARKMDAARLIVDMSDPQMLAVPVTLGQKAGEKPPGRFQPVQTQRFGTLMKHGATLGTVSRQCDQSRVRFGGSLGSIFD